MPEFILNTDGGVVMRPGLDPRGFSGVLHFFDDLDAFTRGYIEALFFTEGDEPGRWFGESHDSPDLKGFADLAPEALARIITDCAAFQDRNAWTAMMREDGDLGPRPSLRTGGMDFWYTRNGHGAGFWDGDWPEPYASDLTAAAKAFGSVDAYLGDDGKVYLS